MDWANAEVTREPTEIDESTMTEEKEGKKGDEKKAEETVDELSVLKLELEDMKDKS